MSEKVSLLDKLKEEKLKHYDTGMYWNNVFVKEGKTFKIIDCDGEVVPGEITNIIDTNKKERTILMDVITQNDMKNVQYGYKIKYTKENANVGVVTDKNTFMEDITVKEYIKFIYNSSEFNRDIRDKYPTLMVDQKNKNISELSTTEKVMLKLAECEIMQREIIFVDLSVLSMTSVNEIVNNILLRLCKEYKTSVLLFTNEASSKYATKIDHFILMKMGAIIYQGKYQGIKKYFLEKLHKYMNEYSESFTYDVNDSTSRCINNILTKDKDVVAFLNEEYFGHKVGSVLNPYIVCYSENMRIGCEKKIKDGSFKQNLLSFVFIFKHLIKLEFGLLQFNCNFVLPEILYVVCALFCAFFNKMFVPEEYYVINGDDQSVEGKGTFYYAKLFTAALEKTQNIFKLKEICSESLTDKTQVSDTNEVTWFIFMYKFYILFVMRALLFSGYNLNLFSAKSILRNKNKKGDIFSRKLFVYAYLQVKVLKSLLSVIVDILVYAICFHSFNLTALKLSTFLFLIRMTESIIFILLYKSCLKIYSYKAMTVNICALILKSMLVTLLIVFFLSNYAVHCDYNVKSRYKVLGYVLFSSISTNYWYSVILNGVMIVMFCILFAVAL